MLRRLFLILTLALLFGLGQQGAAVHAISHLGEAQTKSPQDKQSHHVTFCDKCIGYAALDGVVASGHIALHLAPDEQTPFIQASLSRSAVHTRYYATRAPPVLV